MIKDLQGLKMFIHIGGGKYLRSSEIVGFFDIETTTGSSITKDYLKATQDHGNTLSVCTDLPKSFVVTAVKKGGAVRQRLYLSASAVKTLRTRSN